MPKEARMSRARFRIRTFIIAIAAVAVVMGVIRLLIWMRAFFKVYTPLSN
jgi:hypothetical protein